MGAGLAGTDLGVVEPAEEELLLGAEPAGVVPMASPAASPSLSHEPDDMTVQKAVPFSPPAVS